MNYFGSEILNKDLNINRSLLRQKIFENPKDKIFLENLIHPEVRQTIEKTIQASDAPIICLVIPLLKSRDHYPMIEKLIVIDTHPDIQRNRLIHRDKISPELADAMINSQLSQKERLALINKNTDFVIHNHEDLVIFEKNFEQLLRDNHLFQKN